MTVQDTGIVQVTGTGSVATYTFGFRILQAADLVVVVTDLLGDDTTLIQVPNAPTSAQYTLNTVPDIYGGGSITLGMGNLPAGYLLTMKRNPAITQTESYQQLGPFPATQFEQGLDELTMQVQALSQVASVQFPLGDPVGLNNVLPSAYDRAGFLLGFGANGAVIATSGSTVSIPSQSVSSVTALKAVATPTYNGEIFATAGYANLGDGGAGFYAWNATDTRNDNAGSIIQITGVTPGRFNLLYPVGGTISAIQFGASVANADNSTAINNAITWAFFVAVAAGGATMVVLPPGQYNIQNQVTPLSNVTFRGAGPASTTIYWNSGSVPSGNGAMIDMSGATTQCRLENLTLNGATIAHYGVALKALDVNSGMSGITCTGVTVYDFYWLNSGVCHGSYERLTYATAVSMASVVNARISDLVGAGTLTISNNCKACTFVNTTIAATNAITDNGINCTFVGLNLSGGGETGTGIRVLHSVTVTGLQSDNSFATLLNDITNAVVLTGATIAFYTNGGAEYGTVLYNGALTTPTLTTPIVAASAAPTAIGSEFVDSAYQGLSVIEGPQAGTGITKALSGTIAISTAQGGAVSTNAATSLFATVRGTQSLPASFWTAGKMLCLRFRGVLQVNGGGTITVVCNLHTSTLSTTGALTPTQATAVYCDIEMDILCRTSGAAGVMVCAGRILYGNASSPIIIDLPATVTTGFDTTAAASYDALVTFSVASASNQLLTSIGYAEAKG